MPVSPLGKSSLSYQNPLKRALGQGFFREIPRTPGVYFLLGAGGRLLYVGKAKSLRARLTSYARLKPGSAAAHSEDRLLELVELVRVIRWENHSSERKALARESELLRVLKPPYNVAGTDEEIYLYWGVRRKQTAKGLWLDFRLSNLPDFGDEGYEIFGGYRNRGKVKRGYTALLRLLHAYQCDSPRFSYPARISRDVPPWQYRSRFPGELEKPLRDFLSGRSRKLLSRIFDGLLANERIPAFMRPSIQDDIEAVKALFRKGPGVTRELRMRHGVRERLILPRQLSELVEKDVLGADAFK